MKGSTAIGSALGAFIFGLTPEGVILRQMEGNGHVLRLGDRGDRNVVEFSAILLSRRQGEDANQSTPIMQLPDVGKSCHTSHALKDVSLTSPRRVTGIRADNGAGKVRR